MWVGFYVGLREFGRSLQVSIFRSLRVYRTHISMGWACELCSEIMREG